ncbi:hypothetical protein DPX16_3490 [Anabarilius grahami]|uniref:Uncharacterized protein n=1 Tax=Anabarilius grahami TaxID=495550 RepID=A0A3N0Y6P0_ANAGA|nr:hypothetical protein DPX16_3490 [Anabarilius grahami]
MADFRGKFEHAAVRLCVITSLFQKKVLSLLVDIRHRLKETQPASSAVHIERIDTVEDFEIQEQRLSDAQAFGILVEGIMKFDSAATEEYIKMNVAEHLKHAPQRLGGGGFTTP